MNDNMPKDPYMLLSFINMKLRDEFDSLEAFCSVNGADVTEITDKLRAVGFEYDKEINQFR